MSRRTQTGKGLGIAVTGSHLMVLLILSGIAGSASLPPAIADPAPSPPAAQLQPSVDDEIAALAHLHALGREAGRRLVERGETALPELHRALLAPESTDEQRIQLTTVLGEIGDSSSIGPLIKLAEANPGQLGIRQEVLAMLAELPATPAAVAFAESVLDDVEEHYLVQRRALVYFGQQREERGRRFVSVFADSREIDLAVGTLYLAARLGDASVKPSIEKRLADPVPPSARYTLMLAYAELATPAEFELHTPEYLKKSLWEYDSALRIARFRVAVDGERLKLAKDMMMLRSGPYEKQIAAQYILADKGAESLAQYVSDDGAPLDTRGVARHQLRRAGYRVVERDGRALLERKEQP